MHMMVLPLIFVKIECGNACEALSVAICVQHTLNLIAMHIFLLPSKSLSSLAAGTGELLQ